MTTETLLDMEEPVATPASARDRKKGAEANALKLLPKIIEAARWGQQDTAEKIGRDLPDALPVPA